MILKKGKHVTVDTNTPYGNYNFYNVEDTDYYINTTIFQIEKDKTVERFINTEGFTVEFTDEPYLKIEEYSHLIEYAKELYESNKNR